MPQITVLIFRGTGGVFNPDHPYHSEPALVRAGHVGMEGIIPGKIIGFHPTDEAAEAIGGEKLLLEALREHDPQPGCLQDDTAVFERAHALVAQTRGRTTVYMYAVDISQQTLETIKQWYNESQEALYNFPQPDGSFKVGEYNCAMFLNVFNINLPYTTGSIKQIVNDLKLEGYMTWQPTIR